MLFPTEDPFYFNAACALIFELDLIAYMAILSFFIYDSSLNHVITI